MQELKTDEFSLVLDRTFRNDLIDNFKIIQQYLDNENDYDSIKDQINSLKDSVDSLQNAIDELQKRINHLYAGDPQTIKAVVTEILEEKGVI